MSTWRRYFGLIILGAAVAGGLVVFCFFNDPRIIVLGATLGCFIGEVICAILESIISGDRFTFQPIEQKMSRRVSNGKCKICAYDRRGHLKPNQCPECGAIDPLKV